MHTEKFWQQNAVNFNIDENLTYINKEIQFLQEHLEDNSFKMCTKKAVICYDLGEFARFFSKGRTHLENAGRGSKESLMTIM